MLGVAERTAVFAEANGPEFAGPGKDVLKQVVMDRPIVANTQVACRQRFFRALRSAGGFELGERRCVAKTRNVPEDGCAGIALRICYGIVVSGPCHTCGQWPCAVRRQKGRVGQTRENQKSWTP